MITRREFSKSVLAGGAALVTSGNPSLTTSTDAIPPPPQDEGTKTPKKYDLLIKGGTVVDPSQGLHSPLDIAVVNGKIFELSPDIPEDQADEVFAAKDRI